MDKEILVTRSFLPPFEEYCAEIRELWDSRWLTNAGCKHEQLGAALQQYLSAPELALFTNGHLALEAVLRAMDLHGEVITTPFTFISTTHAIVRCGLTPVFCDIRPDNYTLDAGKLEALITERTCAILPVHVYGNLCDTEAIAKIAKKHGLKVIYDAAHAFGVRKNGVGAGSFGDASMFSFHATKVFHSIEGGAVACHDPELRHRLELERNYGITGPENVVTVGGNAKMNEFQAAMGLCNLRHIGEQIRLRGEVVAQYRTRLEGREGLLLCLPSEDVQSNFGYFPVVFEGGAKVRDSVFCALTEQGVHTRKYFYPATNEFECFAEQPGFDPKCTPIAHRISQSVLTLPLYADLDAQSVDKICDIVLAKRG